MHLDGKPTSTNCSPTIDEIAMADRRDTPTQRAVHGSKGIQVARVFHSKAHCTLFLEWRTSVNVKIRCFGGFDMKLKVALAFALLFPNYAHAVDANSYSKTLDVFYGGSTVQDYIAHYTDRIVSNLQGTWISMSGIDSASFGSVFPKTCSLNPYYINNVTPLGFDMIRGKEGSKQIHSHYSLMTGNTFVQVTPQEELVQFLDIGSKTEFDKRMANTFQNGLVTIIKPEEGMLVMQRNYSVPTIFIKCPS